jgi:hypothetical protein
MSEKVNSPKSHKSLPVRPWTFLAYIAGDNNLSDAGLEDIDEMCKKGSSSQLYAGVQIDTIGEHDGSVRYEISEPDFFGEAHRIVIKRLKESNSGNPVVLKNFLKWGLERYPAQNTLAVIWNHGSGFRTVRRDIAYDDFGTSLDMPEIEEAFKRAFSAAGLPKDYKFGVLGFDACLMNMLEIAHHFRDQVRVIVGSQQTEPGDGWPYDDVLGAMKENLSPEDLGRKIVNVYIDDYKARGETGVTQSAIDVGKTEAAVLALGALGTALRSQVPTKRSEIRTARMRAQSYQMADYIDLVHVAQTLAEAVPAVAPQVNEVVKTTKACVLESQFYGHSVRNSNGLSIWFPSDPSTYFNYRPKYQALKSSTVTTGWVDFLDAYFS